MTLKFEYPMVFWTKNSGEKTVAELREITATDMIYRTTYEVSNSLNIDDESRPWFEFNFKELLEFYSHEKVTSNVD